MNIARIEPRLFCLTHGVSHQDGIGLTAEPLVYDNLACHEVEWPGIITLTPDSVSDVSTGNTDAPTFTLARGDLAYLDTFGGGLVPVKVLLINGAEADVRVMAARRGYERGEVVTVSVPNNWLIHRKQVHVRRGQYRVSGHTRFTTDAGRTL